MLKRYISKVVKLELAKEKLNKQFGKQKNYVPLTDLDYEYVELREKIKWLEHDNITLKDLYEQEKNKNYKTLESEELKQEIEKLKKENKQLKNLSCTILIDNEGKLDSLFNNQLRKENEKLKDKLYKIKGIIHVQHKRTYTNDNLMRTIKLIEEVYKES